MMTERRKVSHASPIFIAVLTVLLGASVTFIGWVGDTGVKFIVSSFDNLNEKQDMMFKKIDTISMKENTDIACLSKSVFACCGTRASVSC